MTVKTGTAWAGSFVTLDATGALSASTDAAGVLYIDGVANAATVTITGSNPYKWSVTLPALTAGQRVDMYITGTIDSIATAGFVASEQADTALVSEVKTDTAAILADTGTDGVKIANTQGAITWGQQKIVADVEYEGALDIVNTNLAGRGMVNSGYLNGQLNFSGSGFGLENASSGGIGQRNIGPAGAVKNISTNNPAIYNEGSIGTYNKGTDTAGVQNEGTTIGEYNVSADGIGQLNAGDTQNVEGFDPAIALEATLTAIKGAGWSTETLAAIDVLIDAIKAKTDLIPATPAVADEYDAALAAIQADLDNPNQYKADVSGLATAAALDAVDNFLDTEIASILEDTGTTLPASIAAVKAETASILEDTGTTIPAAITTIDNEIAVIDGNVDAILDDTGTSGVLLSTSALTSIFDDEVIVGSYNFSDLLKIMASALAGKLSGGGTTTLTFRSVDDTSDVIVTTVDANKNRTNVVITV